MYQAASTYAKNALQAADPRNQEAQLLMMAATRLQAVKDNWENRKTTLDPALVYNQKLWTAIVTLVSAEDNQLPVAIRANILNLANFVFNHSFRVLAEPEARKLDILISVNRNIALGLRGIGEGEEKAARERVAASEAAKSAAGAAA
jgi:flagellar biosynthesis activator protein FlaF